MIQRKVLWILLLVAGFVSCELSGNKASDLQDENSKDSIDLSVAESVLKESHAQGVDKQGLVLQGSVPAGLRMLKHAYPDFVKDITKNALILKDGTTMMYDDGRKDKSFEQLLNEPDLQDMLESMIYMKGKTPEPGFNEDPGRVRYEPFFMKMYGASAQEVEKNLVTINWMPETNNGEVHLNVSKVNNVHLRLQEISAALDTLSPGLKKYVKTTAGVFNWRNISGTRLKSVHSFAVAIDINVEYSNYWRWSKGTYRYQNKIPWEIVKIFEDHGFIWGGKWYHYDTMHFEYRPELLINNPEKLGR